MGMPSEPDPAADSAAPWVPPRATVRRLRAAATDCRGCELWRDATQVVVSSGPDDARLVLVGEQPGDQEDRQGEPFVGPAGRLLDQALERAGIPRQEVYLTNAVKHFRFEQRGKRRIHQKPELRHLVACGPWLQAELDAVDPRAVVALGATAGRALLGGAVRIGAERGRVLEAPSGRATGPTTHPSALLRLRDRAERETALEQLAADLRVAGEAARAGG
jgi:DNA polymerase